MQYDHILVRFGELTTKGKNRKSFIQKLYLNTRESLKEYKALTYKLTYDRLYILLNGENGQDVCESLKKVFGIHSFSMALKVASEMDAIKQASLDLIEQIEGTTFKIETKRNDKNFPLHSQDISRQVAGFIFNKTTKTLKVDVHHPDIKIRIEVRPHETYVMNDIVYGAGGYPVGIGGKALLMLSGGIDSPVAGYMTLKRGITLECIHYASPPYTSDRAKEKVLELTKKLTAYGGDIKVHVVPFTKLQLAIYDHTPENYAMTVMRRMMYRIAQKVALKNDCLAISNGESVGQVASQTLDSMKCINEVVSLPILRPVVCLDKLEIMEIARKIDTYDISIRPYEDCCTIFTPKQPATKPKSYKAAEYEALFDYESLIDECIENIETITISQYEEDEDDLF